MADPTLLDFLLPVLRDFQNTRYSELASSVVIVYEHIITIDQEIRHVWKAHWTIGKVLFLLNRYYTLFSVAMNNYGMFSPNLSNEVIVRIFYLTCYCVLFYHSCLNWVRWQGWTGLVACALAEIILQLRLYALYYGNKRVLAIMLVAFVSVMATSATIMGTVLRNIVIDTHVIPSFPFCFAVNPSRHFYAFWIPILAFETLLCSLALLRGYRSYRDQEIRLRRKGVPPGQSVQIIEILLRDSIFYFVVMFATYLTTTLIWILGPPALLEIPIGFSVAMSCVISNRLLLNLREEGTRMTTDERDDFNDTNNNETVVLPLATFHSAQVRTMDPDNVVFFDDGKERRAAGEYELRALRNMRSTRAV